MGLRHGDGGRLDSVEIDLAAHAGNALKEFVALVQFELLAAAASDAGGDGIRRTSSIARGERVADALLSFAGRRTLTPVAVAPRPLLNSLAAQLRGALDRNVEVHVEVADSCPLLWLDPQALEDALLDLAINARDAMPDGGRLVLCAVAEQLDDSKPGVAITVSDTGIGMTDQIANQARRPFFTTKENSPMTGLGLAAVDGFARQSGGSMELRTAPGAGTTVTLHLPVSATRP